MGRLTGNLCYNIPWSVLTHQSLREEADCLLYCFWEARLCINTARNCGVFPLWQVGHLHLFWGNYLKEIVHCAAVTSHKNYTLQIVVLSTWICVWTHAEPAVSKHYCVCVSGFDRESRCAHSNQYFINIWKGEEHRKDNCWNLLNIILGHNTAQECKHSPCRVVASCSSAPLDQGCGCSAWQTSHYKLFFTHLSLPLFQLV